MSAGTKRPLADMLKIALALSEELAPYCERIEVAGSIRRQKPLCADVELVCIPKVHAMPDKTDLFGPSINVNVLDAYCFGRIGKGWTLRQAVDGKTAAGNRYKRLAVGDVALDLFSCLPPAQWGLLHLIRTGPADFSQRVVTQRSKGGWLPSHLAVRNGAIVDSDGVVKPTPEEEDVFRILDRTYMKPEHRR